MCEMDVKSKLKRRTTFADHRQGNHPAPNRNPTARNTDGDKSEENRAAPESPAWGNPPAGRARSVEESKVGRNLYVLESFRTCHTLLHRSAFSSTSIGYSGPSTYLRCCKTINTKQDNLVFLF